MRTRRCGLLRALSEEINLRSLYPCCLLLGGSLARASSIVSNVVIIAQSVLTPFSLLPPAGRHHAGD